MHFGRLISHRGNLVRGFEAYEKACEQDEVPGGGWCKNCERYDCGHFLNERGEVLIDRRTGEAKVSAPEKRLRDVLPANFMVENADTKAAKFLDIKVILEKSTTEEKWPGKEKNVSTFWVLENGLLVGWNENPSRGWSFPVIQDPVQKPKPKIDKTVEPNPPGGFGVLADYYARKG
jgi:hypothetical protein